jgi:hypothetical protein
MQSWVPKINCTSKFIGRMKNSGYVEFVATAPTLLSSGDKCGFYKNSDQTQIVVTPLADGIATIVRELPPAAKYKYSNYYFYSDQHLDSAGIYTIFDKDIINNDILEQAKSFSVGSRWSPGELELLLEGKETLYGRFGVVTAIERVSGSGVSEATFKISR